jgi:Rod binding domain-containing protein
MDVSPLLAHRVKAEDLPLDRLASNTHVSEPEKIMAASRAFEALLLRQVLQEAQRPVFKSKYANDSTTNGIYRDMVVEQLADSMAKSNSLGLAQSLAAGLQRQFHSGSAPAAPGDKHAPAAQSEPPVLRSPKDAADLPVRPAIQGPVAAPQTPWAAANQPVSGPPAVQTLNSPKMRDLSDREGRAPSAVGAKNDLP